MPISQEKKKLYPADWKDISLRVRDRAGQKCEQCRAPNRTLIARAVDRYMLEDGFPRGDRRVSGLRERL